MRYVECWVYIDFKSIICVFMYIMRALKRGPSRIEWDEFLPIVTLSYRSSLYGVADYRSHLSFTPARLADAKSPYHKSSIHIYVVYNLRHNVSRKRANLEIMIQSTATITVLERSKNSAHAVRAYIVCGKEPFTTRSDGRMCGTRFLSTNHRAASSAKS